MFTDSDGIVWDETLPEFTGHTLVPVIMDGHEDCAHTQGIYHCDSC